MARDKETRRKYLEANKEKIAEQKKAYNNANKEKLAQVQKDWRSANKEKLREYYKTKRNNDSLYKLKGNIRCLVRNSIISNFAKENQTTEILGCSYDEFKKHLEAQFENWMSWENYGNPKDGIYEPNKTWDIDHIIPVTSASTIDEIIKLNHYTNLKPLCSYVNRFVKKGYI